MARKIARLPLGEFFIGRRTARGFVVHQTNVVQSSTMATRQITFEELSQHNKENDLWLLIDGKGTLLFIFFGALTQSTM